MCGPAAVKLLYRDAWCDVVLASQFRAEQQKALTSVVQQNTKMHKMELESSKERRAEMNAERMERIAAEKSAERARFEQKRATLKMKIQAKHDNIHNQYEATKEARNPYGPYHSLVSA